MWSERDRQLLQDLVQHGEEAAGYLEGVSLQRFQADGALARATERLLEIVGEIEAQLSEAARAQIPIDWRAVRGMRNVLAHQYGRVDRAELYRAATRGLPDLVKKVRAALGRHA